MIKIIQAEIQSHLDIASKLSVHCEKDLMLVAEAMIQVFQNGKKILFFGNGGSASDAQHIAAEFVGRLIHDRKAFPAIALTANSSNLTAIGNDYGFENLFARQIEALANPGDMLVGISTSGKSMNVHNALLKGQHLGCITVGLTGENPNLLGQSCKYLIKVPSIHTSRIQEMHILCAHILCLLVEKKLT